MKSPSQLLQMMSAPDCPCLRAPRGVPVCAVRLEADVALCRGARLLSRTARCWFTLIGEHVVVALEAVFGDGVVEAPVDLSMRVSRMSGKRRRTGVETSRMKVPAPDWPGLSPTVVAQRFHRRVALFVDVEIVDSPNP